MSKASGGLSRNLFTFEMANTYVNLTNVVLYVEPKDEEAARKPALLLNAHFDSALGSPGVLIVMYSLLGCLVGW